ncbi:lysophospholipid acyltransferase family protein [Oceanobacillus halophilus]|uniref:lysophospholipid acyltransferase family protein n=1 Tax=Oceanobacillus halophilus TaxID=930130 RepID=UPI001313E7E5|nr:lysophospholipid acyltransferase family protein [Oceanobacillus halophilus]
MSIEKKPNKLLVNIIKFSIRKFINTRTKIIIEQDDTVDLKGPYLILSNHVNNWDPLFINLIVKEPICFIAGDSLFRIPILKSILYYFGAIPKMKSTNDTRTIRSMIKAKKHNRIIGIFPEGNRNWDGVTEPIHLATAKLAKLLDIPVVIGTIKGGHLNQPRWGLGHRKGPIYISLTKKFDKGEFRQDKPEEILKKLTDAFVYSEMDWQSEKNIPYKGKNLANYLERLLFVCPNCKTPENLHSHHDMFQCEHCNYTVRYTEYGNFEKVNFPLIYSTTHEWNQWQLKFMKKSLVDKQMSEVWKAVMDDHVNLKASKKGEKFRLVSSGNLTLDRENEVLAFASEKGELFLFPLHQIDGLNIHLHHMLDFFIHDTMYRLEFYQPRTSAYKWLKVIQTLLQNKDSKEGIS